MIVSGPVRASESPWLDKIALDEQCLDDLGSENLAALSERIHEDRTTNQRGCE